MKRFLRGSVATAMAIALSAYCNDVKAASATANTSATVIAAIAVSKTADMNFGSIVPTASAATVTIGNNGSLTSTLTTTGAHSAAAFNVTGGANEAFSVSLPASASLSDGASHTMTVDTFSDSLGAAGTLNGSGTASFTVGGVLHVGASQAAGAYTGTFQVTVAYN